MTCDAMFRVLRALAGAEPLRAQMADDALIDSDPLRPARRALRRAGRPFFLTIPQGPQGRVRSPSYQIFGCEGGWPNGSLGPGCTNRVSPV